MITHILQIIENIIRLIKLREENNEKIFVNHVEPIYKQLQIIRDDYIDLIDAALSLAKQVNTPPSESLELIKDRRQQFERHRGEIKTYSKMLDEVKNSKLIQGFLYSAMDFLQSDPGEGVNLGILSMYTPTTNLIYQYSLLELQYSEMNEQEKRIKWINILERAKNGIRNRWDQLSEEYYSLKSKVT